MRHLRVLLPYYRPYRRGVALGLILVIIGNLFTLAGPWLVGEAVDALDRDLSMAVILRYAGLIVLAALLSGAARYGMRELLNGISRRIEADLRNDLFAHLLRLPAEFYDRWRTGDLMSRATNDVLAVRQVAGPAIMYLVNTATVSALALALMLWIDVELTLISMIPMVILPPAVLWFGKRIHARFERIQAQFSDISSFAQENLAGARIVKAYVQEASQGRAFAVQNEQYLERNMHLAKVWGAFYPALTLLTGLGAAIVLWFGGRQVIAGEITLGDFVAFGFYLTLLSWPMIALGWVTNLFERGAASMARINSLMATEPAIQSASGPGVASAIVPAGRGAPESARPDGAARRAGRVPATASHEPAADGKRDRAVRRIRGQIDFRGVSFRYPGTERWVLRDVTFRIEPGQTVAIVGATASGKSTLVRLIPRLYDVTEGSVLLDGVDVRGMDLETLRAAVAMVPQDPFLFSVRLRRNIMFDDADRTAEAELTRGGQITGDGRVDGAAGDGCSDRIAGAGRSPATSTSDGQSADDVAAGDGRLDRSVDIAQLRDTLEVLPEGIETRLGERGVNLSGGQKQRATLARALYRDAPVLILDDALSAVDTVTETAILSGLREFMRDLTSIIVSHRVSAVAAADMIYVLEDGQIVQHGTHRDLLARGGTYARLLERQLLQEELKVGAAGA